MPTSPPGRLLRPKFVTRADVQANLRTVFVFGDNLQRRGMKGQAEAMRGEPNTIGVPTKKSPSRQPGAYFSDADWRQRDVRQPIMHAFDRLEEYLRAGIDVAIPADGLGTGLADLPVRAPTIAAYIEMRIKKLAVMSAEDVDD